MNGRQLSQEKYFGLYVALNIKLVQRKERSPMKIAIVHRYFPPDNASCGNIIHCISERLLECGHDIKVLTSSPSYRTNNHSHKNELELSSNLDVCRANLPIRNGNMLLTILNAIMFSLFIIFKIIRTKPEIVIVTSVPPILSAFSVSLVSKIMKFRMIYFVMDIYPEVGLVGHGMRDGITVEILRKIDSFSCNVADCLLVHSEDMRKTMEERRSGIRTTIEIVNNFSIGSKKNVPTIINPVAFKKSDFNIIFSGNVGRFQNLDRFFDILKETKDQKIKLIVIGDGRKKDHLVQRAQNEDLNVEFMGNQPQQVADMLIRQSDICLISLNKGVTNYAYPSKTMAYLACHKPILAMVDLDSELAETIRENEIGFLMDESDIIQASNMLSNICKNKSSIKKMSQNCKHANLKLFSKNETLLKWQKIIERP